MDKINKISAVCLSIFRLERVIERQSTPTIERLPLEIRCQVNEAFFNFIVMVLFVTLQIQRKTVKPNYEV